MNAETQAFCDALLVAVVDELNRHHLRRLNIFVEFIQYKNKELDTDDDIDNAMDAFYTSGKAQEAQDEFFGQGLYSKAIEVFKEENPDIIKDIGEDAVNEAVRQMHVKLSHQDYFSTVTDLRMNTLLENEAWPEPPPATVSASLTTH